MCPRIPWEMVANPLGSAEHILGTTQPDEFNIHLQVLPLTRLLHVYIYMCTHKSFVHKTIRNTGIHDTERFLKAVMRRKAEDIFAAKCQMMPQAMQCSVSC
jgi:hypothetical protein